MVPAAPIVQVAYDDLFATSQSALTDERGSGRPRASTATTSGAYPRGRGHEPTTRAPWSRARPRRGLSAVVAIERLLLRAVVRADRDRLERLLHPDFREFGASGRGWDRGSAVEALVTGPSVTGTAEEIAAVRLADDVVLLTYRVGGDAASLRSSVWVRDGAAGWRLRFHQGTSIRH